MAVVGPTTQRNRRARRVRIVSALTGVVVVAVLIVLAISQAGSDSPTGGGTQAAPAPTSGAPTTSGQPAPTNPTPRPGSTTPTPQPVVIVGRVDTRNSDTAAYDSPAVIAIVSAGLGALGSFLVARVVARRQHRFDRQQAADERIAHIAEARATASFARFQIRLEHERVAVQNATATLRSLRVLAAILDVPGEPPDPRIADLPVDPAAFPDPPVQAGLDQLAENLTQYRVCSDEQRAVIWQRLREQIPQLLRDVELSVDGRTARFAAMSTSGVKQAEDDADAIIASASPSGPST